MQAGQTGDEGRPVPTAARPTVLYYLLKRPYITIRVHSENVKNDEKTDRQTNRLTGWVVYKLFPGGLEELQGVFLEGFDFVARTVLALFTGRFASRPYVIIDMFKTKTTKKHKNSYNSCLKP